jgi:hypothetical protein
VTALDAGRIQWRAEGGGAQAAERCLAFLEQVGIAVRAMEPGEASQAINGLAIGGGALLVDPEVAIWPGDLLHEAGHIAVVPAGRRETLDEIEQDRREELMAIAWSYAAARQCELSLRQLFHSEGYKGRSEFAAKCYAVGRFDGADLLAEEGMTTIDLSAALAAGKPTYPAMSRWLR